MAENRNAPLGEFWKDGAEGNTPLSAENLNARELKMAEEFKNNDELMPFIVDSIEYYCPWGMTWEHLQYYKDGEIWNALEFSIIDNSYVGKNGQQIEELIYFPDGSISINGNINYSDFIGHKKCRIYHTT